MDGMNEFVPRGIPGFRSRYYSTAPFLQIKAPLDQIERRFYVEPSGVEPAISSDKNNILDR